MTTPGETTDPFTDIGASQGFEAAYTIANDGVEMSERLKAAPMSELQATKEMEIKRKIKDIALATAFTLIAPRLVTLTALDIKHAKAGENLNLNPEDFFSATDLLKTELVNSAFWIGASVGSKLLFDHFLPQLGASITAEGMIFSYLLGRVGTSVAYALITDVNHYPQTKAKIHAIVEKLREPADLNNVRFQ